MLPFRKQLNSISNRRGGFVVLFAMVVSLIILLVTSGMYSIARKQVIISSYTRESQKAFYVANSALECALYHDISPYIIGTEFPIDAVDGYSSSFHCGGNEINVRKLPVDDAASGYTNLFSFRYPEVDASVFNLTIPEETGCAYVLVEKKQREENGSQVIDVRITSVGFNTCVEDVNGSIALPDFKNPKLLERRISSSYTVKLGS